MERTLEEKKKLYEKLGAKRFKSLTFKVESIKWKLIKKLLPNYTTKMERQLRKQRDKQLKKATTQEEKDRINRMFVKNVMLMRKEYNTEQNLNYHIDINDPNTIVDYLKRNKAIHSSWLKLDAVLIPILVSLIALGNTWAIPLLVIVGLESVKNMQCINLQNYSLVCYEEKKDRIEKISERKISQKQKKYGEAQKVITKTIEQSEEVPSLDEIIEQASSKESLIQLKQLLLQERENRKRNEENKVRGNVK